VSTRAITLLPLALALALVPAVLAGARVDSSSPSLEPVAPEAAPTTVDLAREEDELLAAGRAVDAGGLHPGLQAALDAARTDAAADGIELPVASGYRSAEEQLANLEEEIEERGSAEEALWWVFTPERSMHVRGLAIDVGSGPAADWLQINGARYGLCKTLDWEWWHVEWRQRWQDAGDCPPPARSPDEAPPP
jgi:zinc D-Ala-D-Ala carboxypeptidase